jgi:hypothetical protein
LCDAGVRGRDNRLLLAFPAEDGESTIFCGEGSAPADARARLQFV